MTFKICAWDENGWDGYGPSMRPSTYKYLNSSGARGPNFQACARRSLPTNRKTSVHNCYTVCVCVCVCTTYRAGSVYTDTGSWCALIDTCTNQNQLAIPRSDLPPGKFNNSTQQLATWLAKVLYNSDWQHSSSSHCPSSVKLLWEISKLSVFC